LVQQPVRFDGAIVLLSLTTHPGWLAGASVDIHGGGSAVTEHCQAFTNHWTSAHHYA